MRKTIIAALIAVTVMLCLAGCGGGGETRVLNVYNWGEYISDGSEDSFDTIAEFEKW